MKSRKYFIYFKDGHLVTEKFWDARFLNQRDGSEKEAHNKWIEGGPPDGS